jgi:hypothetical protein
LLPVASTRNSSFPAEYSASWMDMVSVATVGLAGTCEGVALGGTVAVLVAVGSTVVGVREGVTVNATSVGVADGPIAVGTGCVAVGVVSRRITNERIVDHAPFVPLAVRPRTRHQKVRSLVKVWEVWVCVSPVRERTSGELNELESSIWIW